MPAIIGCEKTDRQGGSPLRLAYCWSHGRREVIKAMPEAGSPIGDEILQRIAALYAIEKQIRGASPEVRRAIRQERAKPLVAELNAFVRAQREQLSRKSNMGKALAYLVNHWDGLCVYLDDGRVEMDNNPVENLIRPLTLNRKNALFAGHDEGAQNWARLASLIGTCKLNGVEPFAYMKATLEALAAGHRNADIDMLLPWNFSAQPHRSRCITRSRPARFSPNYRKALHQILQSLLQNKPLQNRITNISCRPKILWVLDVAYHLSKRRSCSDNRDHLTGHNLRGSLLQDAEACNERRNPP